MKNILRNLVGSFVLAVLVVGGASANQARKGSSHSKITASQASKIALQKYPGRVVGKIALEDEEGKWQYAVNVRSGKVLREVMVDANNGRIANVEKTSKKEEAAEARAEAKAAKGHHGKGKG